MSYFDALTEAMQLLAVHPKTIFIGQSVRYPGHALYKHLAHVPMDRRIELPVIEDFQMGFSTGLALQGYIPVSIFPRWDFLLLAANQLVTHLDKIPLQSAFRPHVIIRVAVGATKPLNSGLQHTADHTAAFRLMLKTVEVIDLQRADKIVPSYVYALNCGRSCLLVEHQNLYSE